MAGHFSSTKKTRRQWDMPARRKSKKRSHLRRLFGLLCDLWKDKKETGEQLGDVLDELIRDLPFPKLCFGLLFMIVLVLCAMYNSWYDLEGCPSDVVVGARFRIFVKQQQLFPLMKEFGTFECFSISVDSKFTRECVDSNGYVDIHSEFNQSVAVELIYTHLGLFHHRCKVWLSQKQNLISDDDAYHTPLGLPGVAAKTTSPKYTKIRVNGPSKFEKITSTIVGIIVTLCTFACIIIAVGAMCVVVCVFLSSVIVMTGIALLIALVSHQIEGLIIAANTSNITK